MRILRSLLVPCVLALVGTAAAVAAPGKETRSIAFSDLSFAVMPPAQVEVPDAVVPQPSYAKQIPERVNALDGQRIRITGFMVPTLLEDDGVREFIIVSDPMVCCFGQQPEIYQYMLVRMVGKSAPMRENMATSYEGVLRVGDVYEHGYWSGIFRLECEVVGD